MQFEVIHSLEEFELLADEWNNLLSFSASHVPFLRHEYLSTWWKTLGGGEWSHAELNVVFAREGDKLVGIAPLFFTENLEGEPALMLLGSIEISDYLDVIARPEDLSSFLEGLLAFLGDSQTPDWRVLDWYNILETSPTLPALQRAAESCGWSYSQANLHHCPYIPLPEDWETYLAGIQKKQRHEIRRKIRRAENHSADLRWYIVENEADLDAEIDELIRLMAQDAEKERFLTGVMRSQMQAAVHAAFQAGWLQLAFLEIDGKKAAGYLNFDYGDHIWVYNSGLNYDLGELSPGWVLLAYLLQWAMQNGRTMFDFMRGDEDYKYRFGAIDRFVVRASIHR